MNFSNFISELKRRNVIRVATAYAIAGWVVIQVVTAIEAPLSLPAWFDTVCIVLVGLGFPIALIIAWAFELTPEGLKATKEVAAEVSITKDTGKKLNGIIIASLSFALIFMITERIFFATSGGTPSNDNKVETASIAVLPFVNMSSDENNEYFSDGLSEELLNGLAKIEQLQVAGRTSSFQFKGTNPDLRDVGTQLGVKHILEGSVRKFGDQIRITAQLIQADNGFHLWSETYDRQLTANDIFDIQEEITRKVVDELKIRLLPEEASTLTERPTQDIEAYNAFLQATQLEVNRNAEELEQAIAKYQEAVRLDPSFSLAYARMAYAYGLLMNYGNLDMEEARYQLRRNIQQALLLDENQGKAYQAQALYHTDISQELEEAEKAALKAVELLPNDPLALNMLLVVYQRREKYEKMDSVAYVAYQLDPLSPTIAGNWVLILTRNERFQEAMNINERILERNPNYTNAISRKVRLLNGPNYGHLDQAFQVLYERYEKDPTNYFVLADLFRQSLMLDLTGAAKFFNKQLLKHYPDNRRANSNLVQLELYQQNSESALELIDSLSRKYNQPFGTILEYQIEMAYYRLGRYEDAIQIIEMSEPRLAEAEPVIDRTYDAIAFRYSILLDLVGKHERASMIREGSRRSFEKELELVHAKGAKIAAADIRVRLAEIRGDMEEATKLLSEIYFDHKNKNDWLIIIQNNPLITDKYRNEPAFAEFEKRLIDDIGPMRDTVIQYLKSKEAWQNEWEDGNEFF